MTISIILILPSQKMSVVIISFFYNIFDKYYLLSILYTNLINLLFDKYLNYSSGVKLSYFANLIVDLKQMKTALRFDLTQNFGQSYNNCMKWIYLLMLHIREIWSKSKKETFFYLQLFSFIPDTQFLDLKDSGTGEKLKTFWIQNNNQVIATRDIRCLLAEKLPFT